MAIMLPFIQKDSFGGPAGSTQNAVQMILQGVMQGMEKRKQAEQERLLSQKFAAPEAQRNMQALYPDLAIDTSRGEVNGAAPAPSDPSQFMDWILSDPKLTQRSKEQALGIMGVKSKLDLEKAQAERYRTKDVKEEKNYEVELYKDGKPAGKKLVPASKYNAFVESAQAAGYDVQKPEKEEKPAYDTVWAYKPGDPDSWTPVEYKKGEQDGVIKKLQKEGFRFRSSAPSEKESGDYLTDKAKLVDDTRGFYQAKMNQFMDPFAKIVMDKDGYDAAYKEMQGDMVRIAKGETPKWLQQQSNLPPLPSGFRMD